MFINECLRYVIFYTLGICPTQVVYLVAAVFSTLFRDRLPVQWVNTLCQFVCVLHCLFKEVIFYRIYRTEKNTNRNAIPCVVPHLV